MSKDELKNFWWGYFLIFPCWWLFHWRIGPGKMILKIILTPFFLLDLILVATAFFGLLFFLTLLAPRKLFQALLFFWQKKISIGSLAIGWLKFFDFRFPWLKKRQKKIFCIGLPKTGTTSVHHALAKAGFKTEHFPYMMVKNIEGELVLDESDIDNHDAISDLPVVAMLDDLVRLYPDAYYIYTYRDKKKWLDSCRRHPWPLELLEYIEAKSFMNRNKRGSRIIRSLLNNMEKLRMMHERVLGSSVYVEALYSKAFDAYDRKVERLLGGRPNFLRLNIADGLDDRAKLGEFLGISMKGPFEKKDCFYTWFFKKLADEFKGWPKVLKIRERYEHKTARLFKKRNKAFWKVKADP